MANLSKKTLSRLQTLHSRYERIVEANRLYGYVVSGNPKTAKYFKVLLAIRTEMAMLQRRPINPNATATLVPGFNNPTVSLSAADMLKMRKTVKVNINDPAFDRPISQLNRTYGGGTIKLITKIKRYE